jgi:hypothetical protein
MFRTATELVALALFIATAALWLAIFASLL